MHGGDAHAIATTLAGRRREEVNGAYLAEVRAARHALADAQLDAKEARLAVYCPGCPHNISTRLPTGARAGAGIGCHYMAQWMGRNTHLPTHMGAEGANWIGQAPFTDEPHLFVNLGDGTYFHSGLLAIRAAVAAGVHVTYKILANDAVAMTGGQPVDGALAVADIVTQVRAMCACPKRTRRTRPPASPRARPWRWTPTRANVFLLGCAFQSGALPVTLEALEKAIELNGVEVADNLAAFHLGRAAALDGDAGGEHESANAPPQAMLPQVSRTLDERIAYRRSFLAAYQDEALAGKYEALVRRARAAEQRVRPASTALTDAVADGYFRLLAVKDEYEVARLFVSGGAGFDRHLATHFAGRWRATYHFAPSWIGRKDARGRTRKIALPGWLAHPALRVLASLRTLRGGPFDVFRHTAERKLERSLLARFEADLRELGPRLTDANFDHALALARLPAGVKGFGPVKEAAARAALLRRDQLAVRLFADEGEGEDAAGAVPTRQRLPTAA